MAGLLTAAQGAHTLLVGKGEPSIDNWTFKLFYKVSQTLEIYDGSPFPFTQYTSSLLLASSFLVTANQFFGDPIQCDLVSKMTYTVYSYMMDAPARRGSILSHPEELLLDVCILQHPAGLPGKLCPPLPA